MVDVVEEMEDTLAIDDDVGIPLIIIGIVPAAPAEGDDVAPRRAAIAADASFNIPVPAIG